MTAKVEVTIHTDGSCKDQLGGWAAVLECGGRFHVAYGAESGTTNNRMEMTAVIGALKQLQVPCHVRLVSDSQVVVDGIERLQERSNNGWRSSRKTPLANIDLWKQLQALADQHNIHPVLVRGHGDNATNNLVDWLAQHAAVKPACDCAS